MCDFIFHTAISKSDHLRESQFFHSHSDISFIQSERKCLMRMLMCVPMYILHSTESEYYRQSNEYVHHSRSMHIKSTYWTLTHVSHSRALKPINVIRSNAWKTSFALSLSFSLTIIIERNLCNRADSIWQFTSINNHKKNAHLNSKLHGMMRLRECFCTNVIRNHDKIPSIRPLNATNTLHLRFTVLFLLGDSFFCWIGLHEPRVTAMKNIKYQHE